MPRHRRALALALPLIALGAAGCGSSSTHPAPDPAAVVPASAPLYASAIVRPQGSLKSNALADARALTNESEPFGALLGVLDVGGSGTGAHHTSAEVESWLGERAGLFITRLSVPSVSGPAELLALLRGALSGQLFGAAGTGRARAQGAVVLDVTDPARARSYFASVPGSTSASFRGVGYSVSRTGEAYGLVGRYMVIGSEDGFKEAIAVSQGAAASIDRLTTYTDLRDSAASSGVLANAYVQSTALLHATRVASGSASGLLSLVQALAPSGALYLSLAPESHQVRLDIDSSSGGQAQPPSATESEQEATAQQYFQALPEDSWLALRSDDFGALGEHALSLAAGSTAGGASSASLLRELLGSLSGSFGSLFSGLGPSLERVLSAMEAKRTLVDHELLAWMGPAAAFVSGSSLAEFNAAAVINAKEPAKARAAIASLPTILAGSGASVKPIALPGTEASAVVNLNGLPVPLQVAAAGSRFIVGLGLSPVAEALTPSGTLGSSSAYQSAVKALGEGIQPALMLNVQTLLSFAKLLGVGNSGTLAQVLPLLRSVTTLTGGTKRLESGSRIRLLLGVG